VAAFVVAAVCIKFVIIPIMDSTLLTPVYRFPVVATIMFLTIALTFGAAGLWRYFVYLFAEVIEKCGELLALVLWPIWSLFLLGFGWEVAAAGIFFDVFAESTPPGRWELHHLGAPENWGADSAPRPVRHAFLHDDPRVFATVVAWIHLTLGRTPSTLVGR